MFGLKQVFCAIDLTQKKTILNQVKASLDIKDITISSGFSELVVMKILPISCKDYKNGHDEQNFIQTDRWNSNYFNTFSSDTLKNDWKLFFEI